MGTNFVSLVIPGRNCAGTIRQCLNAVIPLLKSGSTAGPLREIIFIDDGSTDGTAKIVSEFPVTYVTGTGCGAAAARNVGFRAACNPLIWFVDSDCVAESDALAWLLPHLDDPKVGGVGGSYGNMNENSLLACLIHEEIVERHRTMPQRVDFLAAFNVIYRRAVLKQINGFDERYGGASAEDAELSFRVMAAGYELRFVSDSRVKHYHPTRLRSYLRTQRRHGYWRVRLHLSHSGHAAGDSYSSLLDHAQPPLAMLALASAPLGFFGRLGWVPVGLVLLLLTAQIPMTVRLVRRLGQPRYLGYGAMSFVRAFWRGIGMTHGMLGYLAARCRVANVE